MFLLLACTTPPQPDVFFSFSWLLNGEGSAPAALPVHEARQVSNCQDGGRCAPLAVRPVGAAFDAPVHPREDALQRFASTCEETAQNASACEVLCAEILAPDASCSASCSASLQLVP